MMTYITVKVNERNKKKCNESLLKNGSISNFDTHVVNMEIRIEFSDIQKIRH